MTRPPIRLAQFGLINAYLVPERDGLTLIDAGVRGMDRRVNRAARQLGLPLRRVALTHTHSDHVGAIDTLMQHWPDAELLVGAADTANLAELGVRTAPTRLLRDGDRVGSLTVIDTPGHSPGHVAYLDERDGTLYSGDTFVNVPRLRVASVLHAAFPCPPSARTTRRRPPAPPAPCWTCRCAHWPPATAWSSRGRCPPCAALCRTPNPAANRGGHPHRLRLGRAPDAPEHRRRGRRKGTRLPRQPPQLTHNKKGGTDASWPSVPFVVGGEDLNPDLSLVRRELYR